MASCGVTITISTLAITLPAKAGIRNYSLIDDTGSEVARLRLSCSRGFFRRRVAIANIRLAMGALPGETASGGATEINAITPNGFAVRNLILSPTSVFSLRGVTGVPTNSENVSIRGEYFTARRIDPRVTEIYRYTLARNSTIPLAPPAPCPIDNKGDDDNGGGGGGGDGGGGNPCSFVGCTSFSPSWRDNLLEESDFNFGKHLSVPKSASSQNESTFYAPSDVSSITETEVGQWKGKSWKNRQQVATEEVE